MTSGSPALNKHISIKLRKTPLFEDNEVFKNNPFSLLLLYVLKLRMMILMTACSQNLVADVSHLDPNQLSLFSLRRETAAVTSSGWHDNHFQGIPGPIKC